MTMSFSFVQS